MSNFFLPFARENLQFFGPDVPSNFREGLEKKLSQALGIPPGPKRSTSFGRSGLGPNELKWTMHRDTNPFYQKIVEIWSETQPRPQGAFLFWCGSGTEGKSALALSETDGRNLV